MKEGRKPEYPEKTPDDELQENATYQARKFKPQPRQARTADVLTMTARAFSAYSPSDRLCIS